MVGIIRSENNFNACGGAFLNHIGWKETSKSSDDSDDHLLMDGYLPRYSAYGCCFILVM